MLYFAGCISTSTVQKNNKYYILLTLFYAIFRCSHIDNHNILWYIRGIQFFVHRLQVYYLHRTRC